MNVKIKQELNFVVDNDSRLFFYAQEAKKVNERTVVRQIFSTHILQQWAPCTVAAQTR